MKKISKEKIQTWFVTGASSGVGQEICKQLLEKGYNVIAVARRIPNIEHKNALCLSVDVTKPETIYIAIKKGIERFGKIDVLSNNAGVSSDATLEEENLEHLKEVMEVNFFGIFNAMHAILPHFRQNKNGTIINNTSMHGLSYRIYGSAYCSSKHAVEGLSSVCWQETKKFCRVMTFQLGWFDGTEIWKARTVIDTKIDEYKNIPPFFEKICYTFNNKLDIAVQTIIATAEEEKLPRHLSLGKDSYKKIKAETNYIQRELRLNKRKSLKCSKLRPDIIQATIKKIKKEINFYFMKNKS